MWSCMFVFDVVFFFLFKQKTAYEMRISDWSSDVCSSDLGSAQFLAILDEGLFEVATADERFPDRAPAQAGDDRLHRPARAGAVVPRPDHQRVGQALGMLQAGIVDADRKSVV